MFIKITLGLNLETIIFKLYADTEKSRILDVGLGSIIIAKLTQNGNTKLVSGEGNENESIIYKH